MNRLYRIEQGLKKKFVPAVKAGDTVRVYVKITEGEKERTQVFEGTVIARKGRGHRETINVRKVSFGIGVEKIFPLHSPIIEKIDILRKGRTRRAKLYYLRERRGRSAKVEEERFSPTGTGVKPVRAEHAEEGEPVKSET